MTAPQSSPDPKIRFGQTSGHPDVSPGFSMKAVVVGALALTAMLGGLFWSAAAAKTAQSERPQLFGGTLVLEDIGRPLTVIDVATARVAVRLDDVFSQVGATSYADVQAVAVDGGTMLVDRRNGTFNFLEEDNYVLDPYGPGVGLGALPGMVGAEAVPAGPDAYIVRSAPHSTVSLVASATVAAAAKIESQRPALSAQPSSAQPSSAQPVTAAPAEAVTPPGFASLSGQVGLSPGEVAASGSDLWVLETSGSGCATQQLQPVASGHNGLAVTRRLVEPTRCDESAIEASGGQVAVASPGRVTVFTLNGVRIEDRTLSTPATSGYNAFVPVEGAADGFWYLGRDGLGWNLVGVSSLGHVVGPFHLDHLSPSADPVAPALSNGFLYTLDQSQSGQPTLWAVDLNNGNMAPISGVATYPTKSPTEKADFLGAQVLVDGPRVVFNNPESLEAVVVFTDGSRSPVVIDKSDAIEVSATGPSDLSATSPTTAPSRGGHTPVSATSLPQTKVEPVVQPVSQQVTCAQTTQKPYAPQITSITPSSGTALVAWSYQLLDQTDCEPDSWSVTMTALGAPQPRQPTQGENGQNQYLFTGLRPATVYQVVVTAYINAQSTTSSPETFTTAPRGPDAPISVTTSSDGQGDWIVSWAPCTEAINVNCVVPAATWTVTGAACGGTFVGTPPSLQVPAGPKDQVTIPADSLGLLGDSLSFTVQGSLVSGLAGNPTSDHSCTAAWRAPNPSLITLAAAGTPSATSITAQLQIDTPAGTPLPEIFGSSTTEFVYSVGGYTVGPTTETSVSIPGLAAGQSYTPTVSVYPAGHPGAAVTVKGTPFTQDLSWPATGAGGLEIAVTGNVDAGDPDNGTLSIAFSDLPAGPMSASGSYTCGSSQESFAPAAVSGQTLVLAFKPDLVDLGGSCSLTLTVSDTASPNPYGVSSPQLTADFTIGQQPGYTFTAELSQYCQEHYCGPGFLNPPPLQIVVSIAGSPSLPLAGEDWTLQSSDDNDPSDCDSQSSPGGPPGFPLTFEMPQACPASEANNIVIIVSYKYLGTTISVLTNATTGTPVTTTTSTSTTTTSTTAPSSTTTVPCPTSTTSSTSSTTPCGSSPPGNASALVASAVVPAIRADGSIRSTLAGALIGVPGLWVGVGLVGIKRRRSGNGRAQKGTNQ